MSDKFTDEEKVALKCMFSSDFRKGYQQGRADAIEEFLNELKNYTLWEEHETILEIVAEQLKEQKNE